MTVTKMFQCDICFSPCTTPGSATLLLGKMPEAPGYTITSRVSTLKDTIPEGDQVVRHLCPTCVGVISCKVPPAAHAPIVDKPLVRMPGAVPVKTPCKTHAPWAGKEDNNNG